ncbi:MAG TPA: M28 family peptidase [Gemmataceae bacterium]|nr:M28 family peptidase [Gemmataceae bacterium]
MIVRRWLLRQPTFILLGLALLAAVPVRAAENAAEAAAQASEERLRKDITYLASDELEGRGPTTQGLLKAYDYVADQFKKAGLKPGGVDGSWFQPFPYPANVLDEPAHLTIKGPKGQEIELKQGIQFNPLGLSHAGKLTAPLVFAGYGVTSPDVKYDDFADVDTTDKVVVILRDTPHFTDDQRTGRLRTYASLSRKIANAEKHKAAAVLFVNDADTAKTGDDLIDFAFYSVLAANRRSDATVPVLQIRRSVLQTMLTASAAVDLTDLEHDVNALGKPRSLDLTGWTVSLEVKCHNGDVTLKNVIGVLDGSGPLANETVVVGAHLDHLGYGGAGGSMLGVVKKPEIHHGADDNGSGSTTVMELARRFGAMPDRKGRRIVFMTFSGEELGLEGSKYYCDHPLFPLEVTSAMFNMDMVGRLRPSDAAKKDNLLVEGSPTGKEFGDLLDTLNKKYDFDMTKKTDSLPANSDHYSFYKKKIPVLFFWTGFHPDYHKPSDTADKINVPGMRKITDLSVDVITAFTTEEKRPEYQTMKIGVVRPGSDAPRLGVLPDYAYNGGDGLRLDTVAEEGAAAKAGLKAGDRIIDVAGKPVKNITTYQEAMAAQKKGDTIDVTIVRDGKNLTIKVKLDP